jgi:hypothetical protein
VGDEREAPRIVVRKTAYRVRISRETIEFWRPEIEQYRRDGEALKRAAAPILRRWCCELDSAG